MSVSPLILHVYTDLTLITKPHLCSYHTCIHDESSDCSDTDDNTSDAVPHKFGKTLRCDFIECPCMTNSIYWTHYVTGSGKRNLMDTNPKIELLPLRDWLLFSEQNGS